jgi:uncharacterized protein
MSNVLFIPVSLKDSPDKVELAIRKIFKATGFIDKMEKEDLVAIKIHFGEEGNVGHIQPRYAAVVSKEILRKGGKPFFTDTNTLYKSRRSNAVEHMILAYEHGFTYDVLQAPVIIADGLMGNAEIKVPINGKHFKEVPIARELAFCNSIVSLTHFTGHLVTQFGGTLKNLGMGGSSRAGKLLQHSSVKPSVKDKKCTGCELCTKWCPTGSITMAGAIAAIDWKTCIGCGQCLSVCQFDAIKFSWSESAELVQEKMVEHALGVMKGKEKKSTHITFLTHITAECDCLAKDEAPIIDDIGILASDDPVALDKASMDLIQQKAGKSIGHLTERANLPMNQISYAESLHLGTAAYELKEI